jgi:hypothetical protein
VVHAPGGFRPRGGTLCSGHPKPPTPIPRLALSREEAAAALGMSLDSFERHVQPTLRLVRRGRLRLVPVGELERWLAENAERAL